MDTLSILVATDDSWDNFVKHVSEVIGSEGRADTDEFGKRHVWKTLDIEFIAIDEPGLDDDQGIPFSTFNRQLDLLASNLDSPGETEKFYGALARFLTVRLRKIMPCDVRLIKNLQVSVPID